MSKKPPDLRCRSGIFYQKGKKMAPPNPEIMFCGTVQDTSRLTNPITGHPFFWARVRTLGGELDVVADPAIVKGTIKKNGIIGSMSWLSGRIQQYRLSTRIS